MALSDQFSNLATQAEQAGQHTAAAETKAKADLEREVDAAQRSAAAEGEALRTKSGAAEKPAGRDSFERSWNEHLAAVKRGFDQKKAEMDRDSANRHAIGAEEDAQYALDVARAAIQEAEYAVLQSVLTRKEADELAKGAKV
jgi:hypothetical protein